MRMKQWEEEEGGFDSDFDGEVVQGAGLAGAIVYEVGGSASDFEEASAVESPSRVAPPEDDVDELPSSDDEHGW